MKMKILSLFALSCFLFSAVACGGSGNSKSSQANAYFVVFKELYKTDSALNGDKYLAVDLSKTKLKNKKALIELFQTFCDNNSLILLEDTYDGLVEEGYISTEPLSVFKDGCLVSFSDISLTGKKLETDAGKWCSGIGALYLRYTAELKNSVWTVTNNKLLGIS